jgi:(4S)-4-hydroxy-5-phosphonooxypentane-2,3-dione isomerase
VISLVVSIKVKPDQRDRFLAAAEDDSTCSVRDEPGCLRFDVVQNLADENHYYFYEVYRDEAAHAAHRNTPHYPRWVAARDATVDEIVAHTCTVLFPTNYK